MDSIVKSSRKKAWRRRPLFWVIVGLGVFMVAVFLGSVVWYQAQLEPLDAKDDSRVLVVIEKGALPGAIASELEDKHIIKNKHIFLWYTWATKTQHVLQAGSYRLSASESVPQIVEHLVKGKVDTFQLTFLPGDTLANNKKVLLKAGYEASEIEAAFAKKYDSPLFAGKPASADLEGYIWGETYEFGAGVSVETILTHTFSLYYEKIKNLHLEEKARAQGLSLYQAITLASIIQREAGGHDQAQIAQVFYSRLAIGMQLGSDVTYQYAADKLGVPRDINLDSPYNTRRFAGLPPGPIAVPGVEALKAVAEPAEGTYLFFLSGDDNVTYFARTVEEHERNITQHCKLKCQII